MNPSPPASRSQAPLPPATGEAGFTIIEVIVAALILAIVAAGTIVGLVGAIGDSGIQRYRSAAEALAQQNESQLRGWTVSQLANLNQTTTRTVDNMQYTIQQTGTFVSDSSGSPSCSNPSADYIQTSSKVTWTNMPAALKGVTVTGLITPTAGQISTSAGVLAVQVQDPNANGYANVPVSVQQTSGGSATASGVTASNGCVLFADLPVGSYTVSVTPASGSYVDTSTNQVVSPSSSDQQTGVPVSAGTTAANARTFTLAVPGAATFTFTDLFPLTINPKPAPAATAPSVILTSGGLASYIACSNQDATTCPGVNSARDTSWLAGAWTGGQSPPNLLASPLAPNTYASYAGICTGDDPSLAAFGGADQTTTVTSGGSPTTTNIPLPSIVVRLYNTTGIAGIFTSLLSLPSVTTEMRMPAGSMLVITDTGCGNEHYVGGPGVTVPAGDSYLPVNASATIDGSINDVGVLAFPGMPDGQYTVCYQTGSGSSAKDSQVTLTNKGSGELVGFFNSSLSSGSCAV